MIGVTKYSVSLGGRVVLDRVSFHAATGEFVAVCGPNGAGKTTLLKALAGLLPGGRPDPLRVAYVEQGARCLWGLTVREVVALGRLPFAEDGGAGVARAMAAFGIEDLADRRIDRISGGQARRAMLARALAGDARVFLLDEPLADLDADGCVAVMGVFRQVAAGGGCVVAVLHAAELAERFCSRIYKLGSKNVLF